MKLSLALRWPLLEACQSFNPGMCLMTCIRVRVACSSAPRAKALKVPRNCQDLSPLEIFPRRPQLQLRLVPPTTPRTITNDQTHHLRQIPFNYRQNAWRYHCSRCRCKFLQFSAMIGFCDPDPNILSLSRPPRVSPAELVLADVMNRWSSQQQPGRLREQA